MLERSKFLNYLIDKAGEYRGKKEQLSISANMFFLAALDAVIASGGKTQPAELKTDEAVREVKEIKELLVKYDIDANEARKGIKEDISAPDYKSLRDDLIFGKVKFGAARRAEQEKRPCIDSVTFMELLLEEPSDAIRRQIMKKTPTTPADNMTSEDATAAVTDETPASSSTVKPQKNTKTTKNTKSTTTNTTQTSSAVSSQQDSAEQLAKIVKKTREVQKTLLENIYGQDNAVNTFVSGYFRAELVSMYKEKTHKPRATFLFAGPPGVGKTFLAESAAEVLKIPFRRFDMSEYAEDESCLEFCGSDVVYKNGHAGNVTDFVSNHPRCMLLFDEIEKAHISVIYLFLQMLDAGRLRDNFTDKEVSFEDCIIIFTTNAGRNLYEDQSVVNISSLPRKKILRALETDTDPATKKRLFPTAICSRFASGNVVMFNHLGAHNLYTIVAGELRRNIAGFKASTGIDVVIDNYVPTAMILSEGGKADARTVKGRAGLFFHEEIYELLRLLPTKDKVIQNLDTIHIRVSLDDAEADIKRLFTVDKGHEVLIFTDEAKSDKCRKLLPHITCHLTSDLETAKEILDKNDISIVICDVFCNPYADARQVLNAEDIESEGSDFLSFVLSAYNLPVYLLQGKTGEISQEEFLSFAERGVSDILTLNEKNGERFEIEVVERCDIAYQQSNMMRLARENKVMYYNATQAISEDGKRAEINLCNFRLALTTDAEDSHDVLDQYSRPKVRFEDVIGAEDAKDELAYFVEYMKNPVKFLRRGVRPPKGVLLYGPPGTGKTLLAKAMAGESDVTFFSLEGNQFLKKYVGEGAESVHKTFQAARKYAPSIIFIDEIDAIAVDRKNGEGSHTASNVLTAFLTEMDGFKCDAAKPVFVLAATNFDVEPGSTRSLDPALMRRFDRRIYVDLPTKDERKKYIRMKIDGNDMVKLSEDQVENIAVRSTGMSLAELESVYELALRIAIRSDSDEIGDEAFEEAFETFQSGERKEWSADTLLRTARHEAGHALLCRLSGEKPSYITIVARADHGGYMQHADREGKQLYTRSEMLMNIRTSLGGRAAELVCYGEEDGYSTGASSDLQNATRMAEQMICRYGMDSEVGIAYIDNKKSDAAYYTMIRPRVNVILTKELNEAIKAIQENRIALDKMAEALLERDHLREHEIEEIFAKYLRL